MSAVRTAGTADVGQAAVRPLQPLVHELAVCVAAPTTALSGRDGQLEPVGAQGVFHGDVRVLSRSVVTVGGLAPEPVSDGAAGRGRYEFVGLLRTLGDAGPDPTVRLDRARVLVPGRCTEHLVLRSTAAEVLRTRVEVRLEADLADVAEVKHGQGRAAVAPDASAPGWSTDDVTAKVVDGPVGPSPVVETRSAAVVLAWDVEVPPRSRVELSWTLAVQDDGGVVAAAPDDPDWPAPRVDADDRRLAPLLQQSLEDLHGLRMVTTDRPDDAFAAAGSPWYLTLFGRDSIWAARLALPFGWSLAAGTLRTLAARQGRRDDAATMEQPGKILHEVRRAAFEVPEGGALGAGVRLPAQYYGTVDATPLWVCLLHDAWRWGMPADQVDELLDAAVAALDWVVGDGDADGDGFLEYVDRTGTGLANQGWKDSGDSVRFVDGSLAEPPIALCEVQGYAHEAATRGADLLEAFGRDGGRYRTWAEQLRSRFREQFWATTPAGRYPAIALDGDKRRVDALTSNVGHLLGTGLLDAGEAADLVALLTAPGMDSGWGLRTMDTAMGGYSPLSYHCGTVWPHDTAVVVRGMALDGHAASSSGLVEGLLAAGSGFEGRVPELYGGDPREHLARPVPYPAACRPQAWSAAAAVALVGAVLGVEADVPGGVLRVRPAVPSPVGHLRVEGLRVGDELVTVEVDADGEVVEVSGTSLRVEVA